MTSYLPKGWGDGWLGIPFLPGSGGAAPAAGVLCKPGMVSLMQAASVRAFARRNWNQKEAASKVDSGTASALCGSVWALSF
ncbi:MAG: hypothetical protein RIB86_14280 [Imperialibacter sp.]